MHFTDIIRQFNPWLKGASVKDLSADLNVAFIGASARSASKFSLLLYIHSLPPPLRRILVLIREIHDYILHSVLQIISLPYLGNLFCYRDLKDQAEDLVSRLKNMKVRFCTL